MPDVQEVFRMATQKVRPDPGALERQNRNQRRRSVTQKAGGYALLAILVVAVAVIAVVILQPRDERPAGQREGLTVAGLTTRPHFLDLETGERTLLADSLAGGYSYVASPDGTRLVYERGAGCTAPQLTVANIDGTDVQAIEAPEGRIICGARWSPDGTRLVYQEKDETDDGVGNLVVHDLSNGQRTRITDLELRRASWYFLSPTFSPDGDEVLFHLPRSSFETTRWDVWSVPSTGGEPTLVLRNATFPMPNPVAWGTGPEGLVIQFVEPTANDFAGRSIMTARPIPGSDVRDRLAEANSSIWWPTVSPDGTRIAYQDGGSIYLVHLPIPGVEGGEVTEVGKGGTAEWLDNDTLIVTP
jgi:Tol biopolymer transport system component